MTQTPASTLLDVTGLDGLAPRTVKVRDASHFRHIIAAQKQVAVANQNLVDAVMAARDAGESWTVIGAALGITKQAAQKRFRVPTTARS